MSLRQRSNLEESVNERRNYRSGSKNYQSAEQNQPHDNRKEPEFFPLFHKRPQVHQELTHNASSSSLPPGKRKPRWVPLTTAMAVTDIFKKRRSIKRQLQLRRMTTNAAMVAFRTIGPFVFFFFHGASKLNPRRAVPLMWFQRSAMPHATRAGLIAQRVRVDQGRTRRLAYGNAGR